MSTAIIPNSHVADRAYHLWEQAGRPHGRDLEFWIQAEADVRASSKPHKSDLAATTASPLPHPHSPGTESRPHTNHLSGKRPRKPAASPRQP